MIEKLYNIQDVKRKFKEVENEKNKVCAPLLCDFDMIPTIYKWFLDFFAERNCPPNPASVYQRKKFIFIVLYIFAPSVLLGDKMPVGLRDRIWAALYKTADKSVISHNCEDLLFYFTHYTDFKKDVEDVFDHIKRRLNEEGIV